RVVQLVDFLMDAVEDDARILSATQQREAFGNVGVEIEAYRAARRRMRCDHARDVTHPHRRAVMAGEDNLLDVARVGEVADAADGELLTAEAQDSAADIAVRLRQRVRDIRKRQVVREKAGRIDLYVNLFQKATEADNVGDAGHLLEHARDSPLQLAARLGQR